jgi:hypothetical protein
LTARFCGGVVLLGGTTPRMNEEQLRERLRKVEALYFGATSPGEREAASAAADRLKAKLEEVAGRDPPVEMKFSLPGNGRRAYSSPCAGAMGAPLPLCPPRRTTIVGESAAALLRCGGVATVLRPAYGSVDLFRANDGAADQRSDPYRHDRRRNGGRPEPVELTADHAASSACSRAAFQFQAASSAPLNEARPCVGHLKSHALLRVNVAPAPPRRCRSFEP